MADQQFQSLGCVRLFIIVFERKNETTQDTENTEEVVSNALLRVVFIMGTLV